ncbi:Cytochrome c oxidase polypeptide IV mitochondrial [Pyrenophora tritici-repentis]|nr:Cytochrome c oxidase polypeptide IV mitochondrial [Pyrenophora tritici-repentis]
MFLQRSAIAVARRAAPASLRNAPLPRPLSTVGLARKLFARSTIDTNAGDASSEAKEAKENNMHKKKLDTQPTLPVFSRDSRSSMRSRARPTCPPGAKPGTVPTDAEQATGLERLEILGKMQGIDIFDMRPWTPAVSVRGAASPMGEIISWRTMEDPITVNAAGDEQYVGCTGFPADSHNVLWITLTRDEPKSRCMECGSPLRPPRPPCEPIPKPKNMADFLKPEYQEL